MAAVGWRSASAIERIAARTARTPAEHGAVQFGLLAFNIFNEFQDRLGGFTIEDISVGRTESGAWVATSALAEAAFYTGVAYVDKVRFEDGEVWSADYDEVLRQLQEIEQNLNIDALEQP